MKLCCEPSCFDTLEKVLWNWSTNGDQHQRKTSGQPGDHSPIYTFIEAGGTCGHVLLVYVRPANTTLRDVGSAHWSPRSQKGSVDLLHAGWMKARRAAITPENIVRLPARSFLPGFVKAIDTFESAYRWSHLDSKACSKSQNASHLLCFPMSAALFGPWRRTFVPCERQQSPSTARSRSKGTPIEGFG